MKVIYDSNIKNINMKDLACNYKCECSVCVVQKKFKAR
jgi:hypothetical protein